MMLTQKHHAALCCACAAPQEAELQQQHAAELEALHERLQGVLGCKDATIAQLRAELDTTLAQLQQATAELMGEDD
jgi:hypothetical protein